MLIGNLGGSQTLVLALSLEEDLVTWLPLAEIDWRCHGEEIHFLCVSRMWSSKKKKKKMAFLSHRES